MSAQGKTRIVIAGAGPAGSSLAVRLAKSDFEVTLIEKAEFPREKLCGEFISPECLDHFRDLGVIDAMTSAGGDRIQRTVFYSMKGRSAEVPTEWFGGSRPSALGLSRAEMDLQLLNEARSCGVRVIEGCSVKGISGDGSRIGAVRVRGADGSSEISGDIFVDATGRQQILTRNLNSGGSPGRRSGLVAFKAHFRGTALSPGRCEIYFFPGGYGGLNYVEGGAANHCFIMRSEEARVLGGDADRILSELIYQNPRAKSVLSGAERDKDWLAVAIDGFGAAEPVPAPNLFAVGDAAAFIDPFTGSGMLMALESAKLLAEKLVSLPMSDVRGAYREAHRRMFKRRLLLCSIMRQLSFSQTLAEAAVGLAGLSASLRQVLARTTRSGSAGDRSASEL